MRKPLRKLLIAIVIGIVLLVLGYVGLAIYYADGFSANTWINGVYCTGSSVVEVNEELLARTDVPDTITVIGYNTTGTNCEQVSWTIPTGELMLTVDYETKLDEYLEAENPWLWIGNLSLASNHVVEPSVSYSSMALEQKMEEIVKQDGMSEDYYIDYTSSVGYRLYDGVHNRIDKEKALAAVNSAILARMDSVNLIECGCYYDIPLTAEQEEIGKLWKQLESFHANAPFYDFGAEAQQIDKADMAMFIEKDSTTGIPVRDAEGRFVLVEDCVSGWVTRIASETDTYGKTWEFMSTRGELVSVEGKTYGTVLNQEREIMWLEDYLQKLIKGKVVVGSFETGSENKPRIPEYEKGSYNHGGELGDTYIEVDMGMQKLYYYENGELMIETDVVTGNMRRRWDTPEGVNYVYNKQKNRILRGEGYATPVDFWMPVNGAIGIHDADWRSEFGGDEYLTNGSHGCVNVPKEVMPQLYELTEIGTPVVMFYGPELKEDTNVSENDTQTN